MITYFSLLTYHLRAFSFNKSVSSVSRCGCYSTFCFIVTLNWDTAEIFRVSGQQLMALDSGPRFPTSWIWAPVWHMAADENALKSQSRQK